MSGGTTTGRTYRSTRPRGLAAWNPQRKTRRVLDQVREVLSEYADYLPLAIRQIFYRLVGAYDFPKTERGYANLAEMLNRARRSGLIHFDAIRDDGQTELVAQCFDGKPGFWRTVDRAARRYQLDRQAGQLQVLEVWCEAGGMAPQLAAVANPFGIPVYSSGGFDSLTVKHDAAIRFGRRALPTVVLHVGDYDASGCSVIDSAAEDITQMILDYGHATTLPAFERVAITPAQIEAYDLATAPPKTKDRRGGWGNDEGTVQAEALSPDQLRRVVSSAIDDWVDHEQYESVLRQEAHERDDLLRQIEEVSS